VSTKKPPRKAPPVGTVKVFNLSPIEPRGNARILSRWTEAGWQITTGASAAWGLLTYTATYHGSTPHPLATSGSAPRPAPDHPCQACGCPTPGRPH
jgi:hypothetical protein